MNILLIGSGGREHALAWKLSRDGHAVTVAPGNGGTARVAQNLPLDPADHDTVVRAAKEHDLVVVGPEAPLVAGLADRLRAEGIAVFGPSAAAARLEGSKAFTKEICAARDIPTAAWARFDDAGAAKEHVRGAAAPPVVKADGLAAGKGVTVARTTDEALAAIDAIMDAPGASVVLEERLEGPEVSMFFLCDGETALPFGTAQDHKRLLDGDRGPNTGGMGAFSPSPLVTPDLERDVVERIVRPTLAEMRAREAPFAGVLYAGLMLTTDGPKLIEYNVRFGDPECQTLMLRLRSDLGAILRLAAEKRLAEADVAWSDEAAVTVVVAAQGYPGPYAKGTAIRSLPSDGKGVVVFHAGTDEQARAVGGRVLNVSAVAPTVREARERAYAAVADVDWPEGVYRTDIAANV